MGHIALGHGWNEYQLHASCNLGSVLEGEKMKHKHLCVSLALPVPRGWSQRILLSKELQQPKGKCEGFSHPYSCKQLCQLKFVN